MVLRETEFGKTADGKAVRLYTLANDAGVTVKVTNYGTRITEWHVPDREGRSGNVVLGFDRLEPYLQPNPYFGCTAGRYANRIARGRFTLDGVEHQLTINNGPNTLHGGIQGFDKVAWEAAPAGGSLRMTYRSPDGEDGFPGNLTATVTFTLSPQNQLTIDFEATCDAATVVNLTNHTYFNLSGPGSGDVLSHVLGIDADQYTPVGPDLIPTGEIPAVKGTPLDFNSPVAIGARIAQVPGGYDHNFVVRGGGSALTRAARVHDPKSGRSLEVLTTQPGVQFYSGNFLDGSLRGLGGTYFKHGGMCLETQHFPDGPNHPQFPNTVLRPGETYRQSAVYRFSTDK